ncbi:MAG: hypothetical protein K1X86_11850 [Ignavibacteria bacterium]|nr:hypothetical protein [Ignavibacteria bacterium]
MKNFNLLYAIVFILVFQTNLFCRVDSCDKYIPLGSINNMPHGKIELVSDSTFLNGYVVFKLHKDTDKNFDIGDSTTRLIEIFFVKYLYEMNSEHKKLIYNETYLEYAFADEFPYDTGWVPHRGVVRVKEDNNQNFKKLKAFYKRFLNKRDYYPDDFFLLGKMTSAIFDTNKVKFLKLDDNEISYAIFRANFYAGIVKYKSWVAQNIDGISSREFVDELSFFLPVSKAYIFKPVDENILLENGFVKSDWFPDYLYRKCR